MKRLTAAPVAILAALGALAPAPAAQLHEGLLPFRNPEGQVEFPEPLKNDLQAMLNIAAKPGRYEVSIDDEGREVCSDPAWQKTRESMETKLFNMATLYGLVLRDSQIVNDRRLAAYGTFYLPDAQQICELIAFLPGEPVRDIREPAFRRAISFLRVHLAKDKPAEEGGEDGPAMPLYTVELGPYIALLDLDDMRDQAQGLWFLTEVMAIRPQTAKLIFYHAKDKLRGLLVSEHRVVRQHARDFLFQADPEHRRAPDLDAKDQELLDWLDAVVYDVFPPIRPVSAGLTDLYPSEDLERVAVVGREGLSRNAFGAPTSGKIRGRAYRGYRITRLPEPLDKLRIPVEAIITSINGQHVSKGEDIIDAVEKLAKPGRRLFVEYIHGGKTKVMEYRLQK